MKFNFKFERDGNYYFGLALLVIASAAIIWAFFFDGFDPEDFLVYFLIYAWGFTLLLKSDTEYRFNRLEKAVTTLQSRLDQLTTGPLQESSGEKEEKVEAEDTENGETLGLEREEKDDAEQEGLTETETEA